MRELEKFLYEIGIWIAILLVFIAICNHNPEIAKQIGARLHKENVQEDTELALEKYVIRTTVTQGELPAAENPDDEETEKNLSIPPKVASLAGYIPIKSTGTEITQAKADEILATLS